MRLLINKVYKKYNKKTVLAGIDLKLDSGELHVVLGPSGEGKSTLLSIIAGFISQDAGSVFIKGINMNGLPAFRRPVGFVFQENALFPHLNVYQNIAYGVKDLKNSLDLDVRIKHYADISGIADILYKYPYQLSGGQKQRTSLSRALILEPGVLLLDEPLSSVDNLLKDKLIKEIKAIQRKLNITMLYVTHNQDEAMRLADKVSVLHQGRIEQTGSPKDVFSRPRTKFVTEFVGIRNIFQAELIRLEGQSAWFKIYTSSSQPLEVKTIRYPIFNSCADISFCVRPEDIILCANDNNNVNCFPGKVKSIDLDTKMTRVMVDIAGLKVVLIADKKKIIVLSEDIWVQFPEKAFLPLCQNRYKCIKSDRKPQCVHNLVKDNVSRLSV